MNHISIYNVFKRIFHIKDECIDAWFQNGKDSIRVRFKNKEELVFVYYNDKNWSLQTVDLFLKDKTRKFIN